MIHNWSCQCSNHMFFRELGTSVSIQSPLTLCTSCWTLDECQQDKLSSHVKDIKVIITSSVRVKLQFGVPVNDVLPHKKGARTGDENTVQSILILTKYSKKKTLKRVQPVRKNATIHRNSRFLYLLITLRYYQKPIR